MESDDDNFIIDFRLKMLKTWANTGFDIVVTAVTSRSIGLAQLAAISGSCCHCTFQAAIRSPIQCS